MESVNFKRDRSMLKDVGDNECRKGGVKYG